MTTLRVEDRGQSIVELALALPLLAFLLLGGADVARAYALQLAVQNGARAGAEAAGVDFSPTAAKAVARARDEMGRTPGMDADAAIVTVFFKQVDGTTDCVVTPSIAIPCRATVRVRYTFRTITPWPLIPNSFTFDRSTTMRMIVAQTCVGVDADGNDDGDTDGDDPNECDDD
jgi:Flp pilus assembly protein TadG